MCLTSCSLDLLRVLIFTVKDLSSSAHVQDSINKVVSIGKESGIAYFNAIITTTHRVVLVRISDNSVRHTKALRLYNHETRSRGFGTEPDYGKVIKRNHAHEEEFVILHNGVSVPLGQKRQGSEDGSYPDGQVGSNKNNEDGSKASNDYSLIDLAFDPSNTFNAIAHLFEAQTRSLPQRALFSIRGFAGSLNQPVTPPSPNNKSSYVQVHANFVSSFFNQYGIIGCNRACYFSRHTDYSKPWGRIQNVWDYVANRKIGSRKENCYFDRPYALFFLTKGDDDAQAWAAAEKESQDKAQEGYRKGEYDLYMAHETCKDSACIVIIGFKIKIFRLHLVAMGMVPASQTNVAVEGVRHGKSDFNIDNLRPQIAWSPLAEFKAPISEESDITLSVALDATNVNNQPAIEKAIQWVADMTDRKGKRHTEAPWH
ncbi:hypothetical protein BU23DRAFT_572664 [Bimuria novae-zelandiae CBS 107.79]|uniref:Uncharacterized protein n=1 Tax=Bimuria novae-zelandiae CBS 107.79 TaxID=1447943 RepID=A0A6A5UVZ1_9PLEO|nr:hypothetical protein BU23DRAFT_572664 [Bimuria novae-zelandiae CBS 107.79]